MFDRYNVELTADYLNNVCTMGNRFGMFPTVEMIEEYNAINFRPSIIPTKETSQLRALFAEVIPSTDTPLFAINRFKKLVGYKNILFPLSNRYPTLREMANALSTITNAHDIANYDKFARMLEVVSEQNNIPIIYNRVESWETEKTVTPNETTTIEGETSNTSTLSDTTETDGTKTKTGTNETTATKTGTDTTARTGTDTNTTTKTGTVGDSISNTQTNTGTDGTSKSNSKSISETKTGKVAPFDSESFANENDSITEGNTTETESINTSYGKTVTDSGTKTTTHNTTETEQQAHNTSDTVTHNVTDSTELDIHETVMDDTTTERTATNTGSTESTQTRTHTGENEEVGNGKRLINTGLSMAELIEKESVLLPVFDMYLLSIAREITLSCIEEVY